MNDPKDTQEEFYSGLPYDMWNFIGSIDFENSDQWKQIAKIWAEKYYADKLKQWADDEALDDGS